MGRTSDAKERLLTVAGDLIWKQSYGAVSVDEICDEAGVKKGSFYHFFPSKAELAVAAFEEHWHVRRPLMDEAFSASLPPLQRLENYCRLLYESQKEKKELTGHVLGCPYTCVGAELSAQEEQIRRKAEEMFQRTCKYFEGALRDAQSEGAIPGQDIAVSAQAAHALILGTLMHARIRNDIEIIAGIYPLILRLLQVETVPAV
jgi:TetR/AcrR family transcriptional repressor of nem operon